MYCVFDESDILAHAKTYIECGHVAVIPTQVDNNDPCHYDVINTDSKNKVGDTFTLKTCITGKMYCCNGGKEVSLNVENSHDMLALAKDQYLNRLKIANSK